MPRVSSTKERMIRSAARLMRRQGYAATGWRQVVADSGTPWGSQAHFFPGGKEELTVAALLWTGAAYERLLRDALRDLAPADAIAAWLDVASTDLARGGWADGCPIATVALETAHRSDALGAACNQVLTSWRAAITDAIVRCGGAEREADSLAVLVLSAIEGALVLARSARSAEPLHLVRNELVAILRTKAPLPRVV